MKDFRTEDRSQKLNRVCQTDGDRVHLGGLQTTSNDIDFLGNLLQGMLDCFPAEDGIDLSLFTRALAILSHCTPHGGLPDVAQITLATACPSRSAGILDVESGSEGETVRSLETAVLSSFTGLSYGKSGRLASE